MQGQEQTEFQYTGLKTLRIDPEGRRLEIEENVDGHVARSTELGTLAVPRSITMQYGYREFGSLGTATDAGGNVTTFQYDRLGRRTAVLSPDAGYRGFGYNSWSEVVREATATGNRDLRRDALGRLTQLDTSDGATTLS